VLPHRYRLAKDSDRVRNQLVDEGAVVPLINMYHSKSSEVALFSLKVMGELAKTKNNRIKMLEDGAATPMLEGVKHKKSWQIREAAVFAIANFAEFEEARLRLVIDGCTPGILEHLKQDGREESLASELVTLRALHTLSLHPKNQSRMVRDGVLVPLFDVVHNPLKSVKHKSFAMMALSALSESESNHKKITELDGGQGLRKIIGLCTFYEDSVKVYAAQAVQNLAMNAILVTKLTEEGVLDPLKDMLKSPKQVPVLRAVLAIKALAQDSTNQVLIVKQGLLPHLLKMSHCGYPEIEDAVVETIQLLAQSRINRPQIIYNQGFKPLMYTAQYSKVPEKKKEANGVLTHLFNLPGARRDELVQKAAEKFKKTLTKRQGARKQQTETRANVNAAALIFGQGGNDDESSDEN
jgi:vacuolar protein 8